jgi:hypothetical protein
VLRGDLWTFNTPSRAKHVSCVHRILRKRSLLPCVDVIVINKIASIEDDHLETDVTSPSSGMDAIDCNKALPRALGWDISNSRAISHELLRGSHSIAAILVPSLARVHAVCGRPALTCAAGDTLPVSRRRCSNRRTTRTSG